MGSSDNFDSPLSPTAGQLVYSPLYNPKRRGSSTAADASHRRVGADYTKAMQQAGDDYSVGSFESVDVEMSDYSNETSQYDSSEDVEMADAWAKNEEERPMPTQADITMEDAAMEELVSEEAHVDIPSRSMPQTIESEVVGLLKSNQIKSISLEANRVEVRFRSI
ncbi:hypothetical protein AAE478_007406 [Parahypoxylon ruwenzoriense]